MNKVTLLLFILFTTTTVFSQEHHDKRWKLSFVMSQSFIPELKSHAGTTSAQFIPTNGLELEYIFNHQIYVKWFNEVEFLAYTITTIDGVEAIRENAFLTGLALGYELHENIGIFSGVGYEFEKHENLLVFRIGAEYLINFGKDWTLLPTFIYDYKSESHQAFTISLSIGKRF